MMENTDFQSKIRDFLPEISLSFQEPMEKHTSFRIGGAAQVMAFPKSGEEIRKILKMSELLDIPYRILGAGTNVLAPDEGIPGVVICMKDCMDGMQDLGDGRIYVAAGVSMSRAAVFAAKLGLTGLEFAHGIPGSVGGGVYMNAGAYGGTISQVCQSVDVLTAAGEYRTYSCGEMDFSHRHSRLEGEGGIVLGVTFALERGSEEAVRAVMQDLMNRRKASQPLDMPSAGSAFKRPVGGYASALIDEAGLKGYRVGGAEVSRKHAGFVVNAGGATAEDVKTLLGDVARIVYEKTGIRLEPEVRIW